MDDGTQNIKQFLDGASWVASFGVVANFVVNVLPAIVAIVAGTLSAVWTGIRIYEWWKTKK